MTDNVISPSEDDLTSAARSLRISHPTLGAAKLLSLLLEANPNWTVAEKRLRKVLQKAGLSASSTATTTSAPNDNEDASSHEYPTSRMIDHLAPSKWTNKVKVADFGPEKGKGLVATELIQEGGYIWVEDPLVMCLEWCASVLASSSFLRLFVPIFPDMDSNLGLMSFLCFSFFCFYYFANPTGSWRSSNAARTRACTAHDPYLFPPLPLCRVNAPPCSAIDSATRGAHRRMHFSVQLRILVPCLFLNTCAFPIAT